LKPPRPLLLVGLQDPRIVEQFRAAAREAGHDVELATTAQETAKRFDDAEPPAAIVVDMAFPGAEASCLRARGIAELSGTPIIGLSRDLDDLSFPEIYGWGGDDVIRLDAAVDLVPRLRALPAEATPAPSAKGVAVVADTDRRRRIVSARVLHNAGYDVRFALDGDEAIDASRNESTRLVVADADLAPDGAVAAVSRAREAGASAPWVLTTEPKRMAASRAAVKSLAKVAVTDAFAPPENVLFVANELGRASIADGRSSARVLYGTVVAFRLGGRKEDAFGFTYNISGGGLYVRTLAPLGSGDEVWVEMIPPRSDRRIRLEGKVVWRRRFGPIETATVPPGFGVQITDATKGDLARYQSGYAAFCADTIGSPTA
jgi:DNA-binding response OmpR family regulator/Tfp pilus assembly protein PilZ